MYLIAGVNQFDYSISNLIDQKLARATLSQSIHSKALQPVHPPSLSFKAPLNENASIQPASRISPIVITRTRSSAGTTSQRLSGVNVSDTAASSSTISGAPKSARGLTPRLATAQSIQSMLNIPESDSLDEDLLEPAPASTSMSGLGSSLGHQLVLQRASSDRSLDYSNQQLFKSIL